MYNIRKSITGKNLFDKNTSNIINANFNNSQISSSASERVCYIKCKPNTTYTLSKILPSSYKRNSIGTTSSLPTLNVAINNVTYSATSPVTITTNSTAQYIVWLYWTTSDPDYAEQQTLDSMQIEYGSSYTEYEPYENPNITIQDGTDTSLVGCNIEGNSYQYTTSGKNMFIASSGSTIRYGVTYTKNADGSFTLNGTATQTDWYRLGNDFTLSAGTYTISNSNDNASFNTAIFYDDNHNFDISGVVSSLSTKTFTSSVTIKPYIRVMSGATFTNFNIYPMLEKGSNYTGFEPYTGDIASPNPDYPQEVKVVETYNLLPNIATTQEINDVTFTVNSDGSVLVNGTASATTNLQIIGGNPSKLDAGTYILSGCPAGGSSSTYFLYDSPSVSQTKYDYGSGVELTLQQNEIHNVYIRIISGTQCDNLLFKPMISLNGGDYVPYNNIGVNVVGKNLFDKENATITDGFINAPSRVFTSDSNGKTLTINCKSNTTYTISKVISKRFRIGSGTTPLSNNSTFTNAVDAGEVSYYTFTTGNNDNYLSVFYYYNGIDTLSEETIKNSIQIEEGSTSTEYTPYTSITTPIDLQNNFIGKIGSYKDELNIDDLGNVILTKRIGKVVLDGTEDWVHMWSGADSVFTSSIALDNSKRYSSATANIICQSNYYPATHYDGGTGSIWNIRANDSVPYAIAINDVNGNVNVGKIFVKKLNITDTTDMKNWFSNHNTTLYYVLETPYQVNLGKANIELNEGVNYITFLTNLDTRNTIEYEADTSAFREQSYSGESNYRANLTIYHNNVANAIDMSQIARITIKDPIIDTTSQIFYLGSFIAKSLTIKFKNLNGIEIASGDKVTLEIGQLINGEYVDIPIGEFYVDELAENYQTTCEIVCNDASVKFKQAVDYSSCFGDDDKATIDEILQEICRLCEVPIGRYPSINGDIEIGVFDGSVSGKQWISYIAELKGCNAKIDRYGRLSLIPLKQSSKVAINALESKSWDLGEKYSISQVRYYNGNIWYEYPSEPENNNNILYIRNDNPFINSDTTLENIYDIVGDCEIYNVKTQNFGDITLDAYDNITYNLGEDSYQTLNDNTIVYEMSVMATVENKISTKQQETTTNVVAGSKDTQLKMIKTNVDLVNATLTTTAEEVQKINQKFDGYVTTGTFNTLQNTVNTIQTSTYTKTEVSQILKGEYTDEQGNPVQVTKAVTESGTFSDEGLRIQKEDENHNVISKTSGLFNELGVDIERTSDGQNVLYAGMVDENDTRFAGYENQTIVGAENVIVKTYLVIGENSRFQDYTDENNNKGTGCFDIGG